MRVTLQLPRGFTFTMEDCDGAYTVCTIDPPLAWEMAARLADARHPQLPMNTRDDSRASERVGEVVRVHGHCSGLSSKELATYQGGADVNTWHVNAPEGVGVLVAWLFKTLAEGDLDAATARQQACDRATEAHLRELDDAASDFVKRLVVDGDVDAKVNADDPRWLALKAKFRRDLGCE